MVYVYVTCVPIDAHTYIIIPNPPNNFQLQYIQCINTNASCINYIYHNYKTSTNFTEITYRVLSYVFGVKVI